MTRFLRPEGWVQACLAGQSPLLDSFILTILVGNPGVGKSILAYRPLPQDCVGVPMPMLQSARVLNCLGNRSCLPGFYWQRLAKNTVQLRGNSRQFAVFAFDCALCLSRPMAFDPEQVGRAGAFVSIDSDGILLIERGFVRLEDELREVPACEATDGGPHENAPLDADHGASHSTVIKMGGETQPTQDDEDEGDAIKPLPERLFIELTAHRTLALRDAVANNPRIAMTALLHMLVIDCFVSRASSAASEATVREIHLPVQSADLADSFRHRTSTRTTSAGVPTCHWANGMTCTGTGSTPG